MIRFILFFLAVVVLSSCKSENRWKISYSKLTKYQKKIADKCATKLEWTHDHLTVTYLPNETANYSRIIIWDTTAHFVRCDFKFNTTALIKAERLVDREVVKRF